MTINQAIIPAGHPNRRGWKLEKVSGYVVHSTANIRPGTGDVWHGKYFSRPYVKKGNLFFESDGQTPFRVASTHMSADRDSLTQFLPFDEYAAGAGDRPLIWSEEWRGQRPFSRHAFDNRQNWRTLQIEICEDGGWNEASVNNARDWIIEDCISRGLRVDAQASIDLSQVTTPPKQGYVYIARHYDLTGKHCPSKMWARGTEMYWADFVRYIAAATNGGCP